MQNCQSCDRTKRWQQHTSIYIKLIITKFLDFAHCPIFYKTKCFRNWVCFHPQVTETDMTPTLLGPLERADLNHWICFHPQVRGGRHLLCWYIAPPPHLRMEKYPFCEMLCFLVSRILANGQSPKTQQL
jgi:hypothetical protein